MLKKSVIILLLILGILFVPALFVPAITCGQIDPLLIEKRLTCTQLTDIHKTLKLFNSDHGTYPTTEEGRGIG